MDWQRKPGWAERIIDAGVPPLVGSAAAVPSYVFASPTLAIFVAVAAFCGVGLATAFLLRRAGKSRVSASGMDDATLALPTFADECETPELLLDDPLDSVGGDSRVVRLFAPETLSVPGVLANRIDRWLEAAQERDPVRLAAGGGGHGPTASPASAALHSALADIRRTLR